MAQVCGWGGTRAVVCFSPHVLPLPPPLAESTLSTDQPVSFLAHAFTAERSSRIGSTLPHHVNCSHINTPLPLTSPGSRRQKSDAHQGKVQMRLKGIESTCCPTGPPVGSTVRPPGRGSRYTDIVWSSEDYYPVLASRLPAA